MVAFIPPLVVFITFNRMGLTVRNLHALLDKGNDFELCLIDSNSADDTWKYLQSIRDERIKYMKKMDVNRGQVYAVNYGLSLRKKGQYFITVDNDVFIETKDWTNLFINTFARFPQAGLLGAVRKDYYERYRCPMLEKRIGEYYYLRIREGFVEGCCQCLRPELIETVGYWNEENCMGDMEMCHRIINYTGFDAGFLPSFEISQTQEIPCSQCEAIKFCSLYKTGKTCFDLWRQNYHNHQFRNRFRYKYDNYLKSLKEKNAGIYCGSIHDPSSLKKVFFRHQWALENFNFYLERTNCQVDGS